MLDKLFVLNIMQKWNTPREGEGRWPLWLVLEAPNSFLRNNRQH
jgi:hypothetical protein